MKATKKFKSLLEKQRPSGFSRALGKGARAIHSTSSLEPPTEPKILNSKSLDIYDRRNVKTALATEGVHHDELPPDANQVRPMAHHLDSSVTTIESQAVAETPPQATPSITTSAEGQHDPSRPPLERQSSSGDKGHAHDPLEEEPLFLGVGTGAQTVDHLDSLEPPAQNVIAESPTAADFSIYDTAYQEEVDRIRASQGRTATVYLTRRVDKKKEYADDKNMVDAPTKKEVEGMPHEGSKGLLYKAREKKNEPPKSGNIISDLVDQAIANTRAVGREFSDRGGDKLVSIVQRAVERRWESDTKEGK
jgi:[calcium/calmodulin-dependent protein kinase] kinase